MSNDSHQVNKFIVSASPNISYLPVAKPISFSQIKISQTVTQEVKKEVVIVCEPRYFDVVHVGQNPFMDGHSKINKTKALQQWLSLIIELGNCGVSVYFETPKNNLYDQVFTNDHAFCLGKRALLSNFAASARKGESDVAYSFLQRLDFQIIKCPEFFESEIQVSQQYKTAFCGFGQRTSKEAIPHIQTFIGKELSVFPIELIDPLFYHLDMTFKGLPRGYFIVYLPAFSENTRTKLLDWFSSKKISLKDKIYFLTENEAAKFAANCEVFSGNHIISHILPQQLSKWLYARGFELHEIDVSEFHKSGGSVGCLINQIL